MEGEGGDRHGHEINAYRVFFLILLFFRVRARDDDDAVAVALLSLSDPVNVLLKKFERYKLQLFSRVIVRRRPCCFFSYTENSSKQKRRRVTADFRH